MQPKKFRVPGANELLVQMYLDLGDVSDISTVDFATLFNEEIKGFEDDSDSTPAPAEPGAPSRPPAAPAPLPAPPAVDCEVQYKVLFDHFDIKGKNWDPAKFGTDGSGLKASKALPLPPLHHTPLHSTNTFSTI